MQEKQAALRRFHQNVEYFQVHWRELLKRYPEQWVAILDEEIVGANPDYADLLDELKAKRVPLGKVFIQRATDKDELLILSV